MSAKEAKARIKINKLLEIQLYDEIYRSFTNLYNVVYLYHTVTINLRREKI